MKSKTPKRIKKSLQEAKSCGLSAQSSPLVSRAQKYLVSVGIDVGIDVDPKLQESKGSPNGAPNTSREILFAGTPTPNGNWNGNGNGYGAPASPGSLGSPESVPSPARSPAATDLASHSAPSMATPGFSPNATYNQDYSLPTPPGTFDASTLLAGSPYTSPAPSPAPSPSPAQLAAIQATEAEAAAKAKAAEDAAAQQATRPENGRPASPNRGALLRANSGDANAMVDLTMHMNEQKIRAVSEETRKATSAHEPIHATAGVPNPTPSPHSEHAPAGSEPDARACAGHLAADLG